METMEPPPQTDQLITTAAGTTRTLPPPPVPNTKLPPIPNQEPEVDESADAVPVSPTNSIVSSNSKLVARTKSTAPRVPSALRMVMDAETMEKLHTMKDIDGHDNNIQEPQLAITIAQLSEETVDEDISSPPSGSHALHILKTSSSPSLRWSHPQQQPTLQELTAEKRTDSSCCLPYPPLLDHRNRNSVIPKARTQSLNTLSGTSSYRLSIITEGQDYTIYSSKKRSEVAIKPSVIRGWAQYIRGKIAYSFGQVMASPTLITRGNSYMWKGTAQMQLSKQKRQQENSKQTKDDHCSETKRKLERRKSFLARTSKEGDFQKRKLWRNTRRCSLPPISAASDPEHNAKDVVVGLEEQPLSVAQMVAAAQNAADMEILEESSVRSYAEHSPPSSSEGQSSQNNSSETANVSLGSVSDTISPDTPIESSPKELSSPTQSEGDEKSFKVTASPVSVRGDHAVSSNM